jgi:hypothetical protein
MVLPMSDENGGLFIMSPDEKDDEVLELVVEEEGCGMVEMVRCTLTQP